MVEDTDLGWDKLVKDLRSVMGYEVAAGLFDSSGVADPETNIAYRGYVNEYGIPQGDAKIPPRPFTREAWDNNQAEMKELEKKLVGRVIDGKTTPDQYFKIIGEFWKSKIKASITSGNWKPNAKMTIELKGSSKPLIDTGEMLRNVDYKIRKAE